jgi:hypothetical protein
MALTVGEYRDRIESITALAELKALMKEISAAGFPEGEYSELYYCAVSKRLLIARQVGQQNWSKRNHPPA